MFREHYRETAPPSTVMKEKTCPGPSLHDLRKLKLKLKHKALGYP